MKVFITGGLGYVGRHLSLALLDDGHQVTAVGRRRDPSDAIDHPSFSYLAADTTQSGDWQNQVSGSELVVNLAGKSIFTIWTENTKKEIYDSRILTTRNLVDALVDAPTGNGKTTLLSTSAVGYYGDRGDQELAEDEPAGDDFLAALAKDWEGEARRAESRGARVALTRFGVVLGKNGGALAKMVPAFRMFMGGRLGNGRQWFPWIHLDDLIAAYRFIIAHDEISGAVNFCAPRPVRNKDLAEALGRKLNRPTVMPAPAFVVKAVLGEFGAALLCSQRARPVVLQKAGFEFSHPDIESTLDDVVRF